MKTGQPGVFWASQVEEQRAGRVSQPALNEQMFQTSPQTSLSWNSASDLRLPAEERLLVGRVGWELVGIGAQCGVCVKKHLVNCYLGNFQNPFLEKVEEARGKKKKKKKKTNEDKPGKEGGLPPREGKRHPGCVF